MKTTLRYFLIILLLSAQIYSSLASNKQDIIRFVHLTDLHLIFSPSLYNTKFIDNRFSYFWKTPEPVRNFFKSTAPNLNADFFAITGDLIDFYEAETKDGVILSTQIEQFKRFTDSTTNQTLYFTLGNHDITSYPKKGYHQNAAAIARSAWVKNSPVFSNGTYYSKLYKVAETTYRLIFLDNSYFSKRDNNEQADFIIDRPQLDWLQSQINESSTDKEIIFMHMPLPINKVDDLNTESYDDYTKRTRTQEFTDIISNPENSSVQIIIAGHMHENEIHKFDFPKKNSFTQVLTGAFGNSIDNWRLIELTESEIIINEQGLFEKELVIPLK